MYWVVAEISELKENNAGHCYLELVEKTGDDKNIKARVRGIIWNTRFRLLSTLFAASTGEKLRSGIRILFRAKIEYHEVYGLSLVISDIDPSYTLGEMAVRRQMIIKKLEEEGIFEMNRELDFPVIPSRIAVISSASAAGYTDFIKHLHTNSQKYTFKTTLFEAAMQGEDTEESIISALDRISESPGVFDAVAIIRGGGSQSDLSWFDSYAIAFHITQFPLPVITGIGHEKDLSVTDMVAWKAFKTPTAVADYLINCMSEAEEVLRNLTLMLAEAAGEIIDRNRTRIDNSKSKLIPLARLHISEKREVLSNAILELISNGKEFVIKAGYYPSSHANALIRSVASYIRAKDKLLDDTSGEMASASAERIVSWEERMANLHDKLKAVDPVNVLKRGYSLTTLNGIVVRSPEQVSEGDLIDTMLANGSISSTVINKKEK